MGGWRHAPEYLPYSAGALGPSIILSSAVLFRLGLKFFRESLVFSILEVPLLAIFVISFPVIG
jgi:hypothetical protein